MQIFIFLLILVVAMLEIGEVPVCKNLQKNTFTVRGGWTAAIVVSRVKFRSACHGRVRISRLLSRQEKWTPLKNKSLRVTFSRLRVAFICIAAMFRIYLTSLCRVCHFCNSMGFCSLIFSEFSVGKVNEYFTS